MLRYACLGKACYPRSFCANSTPYRNSVISPDRPPPRTLNLKTDNWVGGWADEKKAACSEEQAAIIVRLCAPSACQLANQLVRLLVAETFVEHQDLGIGHALEIQFEVVDGIFDLGIPMHENLEAAADD